MESVVDIAINKDAASTAKFNQKLDDEQLKYLVTEVGESTAYHSHQTPRGLRTLHSSKRHSLATHESQNLFTSGNFSSAAASTK